MSTRVVCAQAARAAWALSAVLLLPVTAEAGAPTVTAVTRAHPASISDTALGYHYGPVAVSQDGRYVAFSSSSPNLIAGYTAGTSYGTTLDVYLLDRATNTMTLVSHAAGVPNQGGNGESFEPVISGDGRWVAFLSQADDLVAGQTGEPYVNVFLFDRLSGANRLVSHKAGATLVAVGLCDALLLSADGSHVAFESYAVNLVTGQNDVTSTRDVFLYDVATDGMRLVSRSVTGPTSTTNVEARLGDVSANGRRVAFTTASTNVVLGQIDANGSADVFVFDADSGGVALASHVPALPLVAADGASKDARLSGDGAYVAFLSVASDLIGGQTGGGPWQQVFLNRLSTGATALVSHAWSSTTTTGDGGSDPPRLDHTGASVAYTSWASDLIAGGPFYSRNVYVFDRASGTNALVSAAPGPLAVGGDLHGLSSGGRYVAYESTGNPGGFIDDNYAMDVFVFDRNTASTRLISSSAGTTNTTANGGAEGASLSADGLTAAFLSEATDAVAGVVDANGSADVLASAGAAALVTRRDPTSAPATALQAGALQPGAASDDGRFVAFTSRSLDLVPGQTGSIYDSNVFVFDSLTAAATLVSHALGAPLEGARGSDPRVSGDGRYVAFDSDAALVPGQTGGYNTQTFLFDRLTGDVSLVSHTPGSPAGGGNGRSVPFGVSRDGRYVLFDSLATDLVAGQIDANNYRDLFLYDRQADASVLVTHVAGSATTTPTSGLFLGDAALAADGDFVAYAHGATDLVVGQSDANDDDDVFVYDRASGTTALVSHAAASATATANRGGFHPSISGDGARVSFLSIASDLLDGQIDPSYTSDVFLFERASGQNRLVSHALAGAATAADNSSYRASLSRDGRWLAYESSASNLVAGVSDTNFTRDVFLYERASDTSRLVSHAAGAPLTAADGASYAPSISRDGAYVAFESEAGDLVAGQSGGGGSCCGDAFRYTRADGINVLASRRHGTTATTAGGVSDYEMVTQIGADGSSVLFGSDATTLVAGDFNGRRDAFLFSARHVKGDLNDDLNADLVLRKLSQPVHRVWTLDGNANRIAEIDVTPDQTSTDWRLAGVDDFNADLSSDLVFRNVTTGAVEFWMMSATTRQGAPVPLGAPSPDPSWELVATADFDHDARPDLLWRNVGSQQLQIWTMNGVAPTGAITPSPSQAVDGNWTVVAALDLDVDGNTDLLWYNTSSGRIVRWLMDAQVQRITGQFTNPMQAGDANWRVLAGGDYGLGPNGRPGTKDIVWRNATSGRFVIWFMDTNGNRTAGTFTNPAAPTAALDWTVAGPR
jgi:Tol biopolymer transport system component